MENPEEVLLALNDFEKLRPSQIPKELEDYLCWVAKTGDPIYQWSLIKVLFREKLLRVMTEFYESCPTLDLTPCPNVDPFNYDSMKSTLLERLENFSNAPFTVQRICELLTTPRKEYNRIDKFMRAVEKNILVVSTKEPGNFGRRSENGDSLVNGSVEDETSHLGQSSNDIDMENWVKDCTTPAPATATVVHTGANEDMLVDNELNASMKNSFEKQERIDQLSAIDTTASSFVSSTPDFQVATTMPPQVSAQEATAVVQNLVTINNENNIIGDVSDAIMNEDTSSQPSLELESDDNDSNDAKKLQTTFQPKDFKLEESKSSDSESQDSKSEGSIEITEPAKEDDQIIQLPHVEKESVSENKDQIENLDKTDNLDIESTTITESKEDKSSEEKSETESNEKFSLETPEFVSNNSNAESEDSRENLDLSKALTEENTTKILTEEKHNFEVKEEIKTESVIQENIHQYTDLSQNSSKEPSEVETSNKVAKPIVKEPTSEVDDPSNLKKLESTELTIQEIAEGDLKTKTIVPDPLPIIEEPKDIEPAAQFGDDSVSFSKEISAPQNIISNVNNGVEESVLNSKQNEENTVSACEDVKNKSAVESMDVDNEGLISSAQQEEPMEQEISDAINS